MSELTCELAAVGGHLEVLKWARENGCPWDKKFMCRNALHGGNEEMLRWMREEGLFDEHDADEDYDEDYDGYSNYGSDNSGNSW